MITYIEANMNNMTNIAGKVFAVVTNTSVIMAMGLSVAHAKQLEFKKYEAQQIQCLATNVYYETRAVSLADAMAVSDVVLNRVKHTSFPDEVCSVVHQAQLDANGNPKRNKCQFSWYCDGKSDDPADNEAWKRSLKYATDIYRHEKYIGITEGATHYHASYVTPYWAPTLDRIARIGSHIFYRMKGK